MKLEDEGNEKSSGFAGEPEWQCPSAYRLILLRLRGWNESTSVPLAVFLLHNSPTHSIMRNDEKSNLDLPEAADIWDELDYESLEVS